MKPATTMVHENERAMSLRELNLVRPPKYHNRRYQIITVVRDDRLTEWWDDLGPAENFTAPEFEIPALFEHSVAELRDMALAQRDRGNYWNDFMAEKRAESTLIQDFLTYVEENWKRIYNQSTFGPGGHKQRNGFPRKAAIEHANTN